VQTAEQGATAAHSWVAVDAMQIQTCGSPRWRNVHAGGHEVRPPATRTI